MADSVSYLTIPTRWRKGFHSKNPARDGFRLERWGRFCSQLDLLCGLTEVCDQINPDRGFQLYDAERFFCDIEGHSFAFDRVEACPWILETYRLTPLIGALQLTARLTLPGVTLTSALDWNAPEWIGARSLYTKAFGVMLWKTPLTIRA